jgi:hypothetical protein
MRSRLTFGKAAAVSAVEVDTTSVGERSTLLKPLELTQLCSVEKTCRCHGDHEQQYTRDKYYHIWACVQENFKLFIHLRKQAHAAKKANCR